MALQVLLISSGKIYPDTQWTTRQMRYSIWYFLLSVQNATMQNVPANWHGTTDCPRVHGSHCVEAADCEDDSYNQMHSISMQNRWKQVLSFTSSDMSSATAVNID